MTSKSYEILIWIANDFKTSPPRFDFTELSVAVREVLKLIKENRE